jgi:16S rRNA C967 or C1407 C5-methylase (RsmB/RsmF family)
MVLTQPERLPFGDGDMDPIWRLNTRSPAVGGSEKRLRVKEIERAVADVPVYDLETDDHYVYLPEADVTVSNCDDLSAMLAALVLAVGGNVRFVTVAFKNAFFNGQRQYSHVFAQALEPRTGLWIVLDPVAAEKTNEMMTRIKAAAVWPIA